nr:thioredoxin domain-containing protein [Mycobacterium paraintracellulare]
MVNPALEQLAAERAGQLKLVKVDIDRAPAIAQRFTVRAGPHAAAHQSRAGCGPAVSGATSVAVLRKWLEIARRTHGKEARS